MAPEFSKAALGVYPMIPFYAVDCDKDSNKQLCAEQGVRGFPTSKVRPPLRLKFASFRGQRSLPLVLASSSREAASRRL